MWSATVSLIVADHYPMDLKTSTDFPSPLRFWHNCGKPRPQCHLSSVRRSATSWVAAFETQARPTGEAGAGERLLTAIELAVAYPEATLILSGGSGRLVGTVPGSAALMAEALIADGISGARLLLEHQSRNTAENRRQSAELVGASVGPGASGH